MISGFLSAFGLERENNVLRYYKKRAIKLLPLYFLVVFWYVVTEYLLELIYPHIPTDDAHLGWLRYFFFLNCFLSSNTYFWSNLGITWTIPVFFWFYVIAPILKRIINLCDENWFIVLSIAILSFIWFDTIYPCRWFHYSWFLLVGMSLFYILREKKYGFFLLIAIIMIASLLARSKIYFLSCILILFFSTGIICDSYIEKMPLALKKMIDTIDEYSYALYLVHGIVFCSIIDRLELFQIEISNVEKGIIAVALSAVGTWSIHSLFEKPVQKWLTRRWL